MKKLLILSVLLLAACEPSSPMVGTWKGGDENSFAKIMDMGNNNYAVTFPDKNGPLTLGATLTRDGNISFMRNGRNETIRMGDGKATGIKELAGKTNCIIIKPGEAYCRDN